MAGTSENLQWRLRNYYVQWVTSPLWLILDKKAEKVLDVGCGRGRTYEGIKLSLRKKFLAVGLDVYMPYIKFCKSKRIYDELIYCDARHLPIKRKSFDVVLCVEVIEHQSKGEGMKLIKELEEIARRQVLITTPLGFMEHHSVNGNIFQTHKSAWSPHELRELGYKITPLGSSFFRRGFPGILGAITSILSWFASPLVVFIPKSASHMLCSKFIAYRDN